MQKRRKSIVAPIGRAIGDASGGIAAALSGKPLDLHLRWPLISVATHRGHLSRSLIWGVGDRVPVSTRVAGALLAVAEFPLVYPFWGKRMSSEPFVDIHCHLVPGIDDGAADFGETLEMARMAVSDGIGTIVATPHQCGNYRANDAALIRGRLAEVQRLLHQHQVPLKVLPGGDVRIEPDLVARLRQGDVLTLADRGRHVLLELPHELYFPLEPLLEELGQAGMVGILSHPERNVGILNRPKVVKPLVKSGCLMQLTAGSLTGTFGPQIQQFSEMLLGEDLVHFISTDAHGVKARRPKLRRAFNRAAELVGDEVARQLCCQNPAQVAAGCDVQGGLVGTGGVRLGRWFRRRRVA